MADKAIRQRLVVDLQQGELRLQDQRQVLSGRWDLVFLYCLLQGQHFSAQRGASAETLQQAMARHGLGKTLAPTQWGRILGRLRAALHDLAPALGLDHRLCHTHRGKTTGPWWWQGDGLLDLVCSPQAQATTPVNTSPVDPALGLARRLDGTDALRLANRFKLAMESLWKADPLQAAAVLADSDAWQGESDALRALRLVRHAEVQGSMRAYADATQLLDRAQARLAGTTLQALLEPGISTTRLRLAYAADPVGRHTDVGQTLRRALTAGAGTQPGAVDAVQLAEQCHLLSLCERRALEDDHVFDSAAPDHDQALAPMLHSAHAALYLHFVTRNYDRAQHVCANLAYAHQRLALHLGPAHARLAVGWHTLSFALHASFGGAESSAWEYIFLGELWLGSADARAELAKQSLQVHWEDLHPGELAFYDRACRVADQVQDPRQQAYALLNRYRFALARGLAAVRGDALRHLDTLLAAQPALRAMLASEGYSMPQPIGSPVAVAQTALAGA